VKPKFEYRYEEDDWEEFIGRRCWSMEDVANDVAEEYWDRSDKENVTTFDFIVEVREASVPEKVGKFRVTADYSIHFYAKEIT